MKTQETYIPIGYLTTIDMINELDEDINIFKGLIRELKAIKRSYKVHSKRLKEIKYERECLRLTLLN